VIQPFLETLQAGLGGPLRQQIANLNSNKVRYLEIKATGVDPGPAAAAAAQ
jgi:hypothetical protein